MGLKSLRTRISRVLREYGFVGSFNQPQIDDTGLLIGQFDDIEHEQPVKSASATRIEPLHPAGSGQVLVKSVTPAGKNESLEKMQEGFNRLISQLENINTHLKDQIGQQQDLMTQMNKLPELLNSLPAMAENQSKLTEQLASELKDASEHNEQLVETLEKIPTETARQTDCLHDINHQLTASAAVEVQMSERFQRFNIALDKLNETSLMQADSITQMGRTFSASDRYMKYLVQRQHSRFTWLFVVTAGVCLFVILAFVGIIIYLKQ